VDSLNDLSHAPLYIQIENLIETKILNKEYLPGSRLPSERDLAKTYGVNRMTIKKAIHNLIDRGLLFSKQGSGTFVQTHGIGDKFYFDFNEKQSNSGITEVLQNKGINVENQIIGKEILNDIPYFEAKLNIKEHDAIFGLHRVRKVKDIPFAVEYSYLPYSLFHDAMNVDFKKVGLYDYMNSKGHQPINVLQQTQAIKSLDKESRLLDIAKNKTIYYVQYMSTDEDGTIVEYTESYLNPEEVNLKFTLGKSVYKQ